MGCKRDALIAGASPKITPMAVVNPSASSTAHSGTAAPLMPGTASAINSASPQPSASPTRPPNSDNTSARSAEQTSELQSLMRISYAVFCLTTQKKHYEHQQTLKIDNLSQQPQHTL